MFQDGEVANQWIVTLTPVAKRRKRWVDYRVEQDGVETERKTLYSGDTVELNMDMNFHHNDKRIKSQDELALTIVVQDDAIVLTSTDGQQQTWAWDDAALQLVVDYHCYVEQEMEWSAESL